MEIITDLDSIKDLRRKLTEVLEDLRDQYDETEKAIETVSETWRDQQFQDFKSKFSEDKEKLKPLCEKIEEYDSEVLEKVQRCIEDYLEL
jgi:chromosome segregation ATPase